MGRQAWSERSGRQGRLLSRSIDEIMTGVIRGRFEYQGYTGASMGVGNICA